MSNFENSLKLEVVTSGWKLLEEFRYKSDTLSRVVTVPLGYVTDLASVPRVMRWLVPVANAKNRKAAVVHDWLCSKEVQDSMGISQRQADEVFREALTASGVSFIGRWGMWLPVRSFQSIKGMFK
jgi:hypothetical protein